MKMAGKADDVIFVVCTSLLLSIFGINSLQRDQQEYLCIRKRFINEIDDVYYMRSVNSSVIALKTTVKRCFFAHTCSCCSGMSSVCACVQHALIALGKAMQGGVWMVKAPAPR